MSEEFYLDPRNDEFVIKVQELAPPRVLEFMEVEHRELRALPETAGAVLDIGCGSGRILDALADRARRLAGVDIVRNYFGYCRRRIARRPDLWLIAADALKLPFARGSFDCATIMVNTLGNFAEHKSPAIREMARVAAGGVVVAGCYSIEGEAMQRDWYTPLIAAGFLRPADPKLSDDRHWVSTDGYVSERFSPEDLAAVFHDAGLKPDITRPIPEMLFAVARA